MVAYGLLLEKHKDQIISGLEELARKEFSSLPYCVTNKDSFSNETFKIGIYGLDHYPKSDDTLLPLITVEQKNYIRDIEDLHFLDFVDDFNAIELSVHCNYQIVTWHHSWIKPPSIDSVMMFYIWLKDLYKGTKVAIVWPFQGDTTPDGIQHRFC